MRLLLAAGVNANPQLNMHRPGRGGNSQRFADDLLTTGATPLLRAAITHDHDAMRALLEHGALVDLPNVMGVTPLMAAAAVGVRDSYFGSNRSPTFDSDRKSRTRSSRRSRSCWQPARTSTQGSRMATAARRA